MSAAFHGRNPPRSQTKALADTRRDPFRGNRVWPGRQPDARISVSSALPLEECRLQTFRLLAPALPFPADRTRVARQRARLRPTQRSEVRLGLAWRSLDL